MRKISAVIAALLVASTMAHGQKKAAQSSWPDIKYLTTFKAQGTLYTYKNSKLAPFQGASANLLVDGDRNKAMVRAKVQVPLFGAIDANALVDFTAGTAIAQVPFLGICEKRAIGASFNIKTDLPLLFDPNSGLTTYNGEESPAWDASTASWHFTHGFKVGKEYGLETYWEKASTNLKWAYYPDGDYVVNFVNGF